MPAHIVIASFVPQALIMQHSAAVVSHTGSGTMLGGLAAGLPQVCLPIGADQFTNAEQVERIGAGIVVPAAERTAAGIRAAIDQVLGNPSYAAAARAGPGGDRRRCRPPMRCSPACSRRRAARPPDRRIWPGGRLVRCAR